MFCVHDNDRVQSYSRGVVRPFVFWIALLPHRLLEPWTRIGTVERIWYFQLDCCVLVAADRMSIRSRSVCRLLDRNCYYRGDRILICFFCFFGVVVVDVVSGLGYVDCCCKILLPFYKCLGERKTDTYSPTRPNVPTTRPVDLPSAYTNLFSQNFLFCFSFKQWEFR